MPTRTLFLKQLEELETSLTDMSNKAISDIELSARALAGDTVAAKEILEGEAGVLRLRSTIEGQCLDTMLMQQPLVAGDLRLVTGSFRIVSDLSRIAEKTRSIAYLSQKVPTDAAITMIVPFEELSRKVSEMLRVAVDSFRKADIEAANKVFALDDAVDEVFSQVARAVIERIRDEESDVEFFPELLMIAKYYERMGDDAQRIAAWTVFRVTGVHGVPDGE